MSETRDEMLRDCIAPDCSKAMPCSDCRPGLPAELKRERPRATLPREEPGEVELLREAIEPLVGAAMQFARDEPFVVAQMKRKDFAEAIAKRALSSLSPAPPTFCDDYYRLVAGLYDCDAPHRLLAWEQGSTARRHALPADQHAALERHVAIVKARLARDD